MFIKTLGRRANVSVEMALTSVFVLLPLFAGGADFLYLVAARSQLNSMLPAFYTYAWNNPASAANTAQLSGVLAQINQHSATAVTFPDGKSDSTSTYVPTVQYSCTTYNATTGAATTTAPGPTACPTAAAQQETVTYTVMSKIPVPVPLPFALPGLFTMQATGQVQIQ